jgi:hypothetical protein
MTHERGPDGWHARLNHAQWCKVPLSNRWVSGTNKSVAIVGVREKRVIFKPVCKYGSILMGDFLQTYSKHYRSGHQPGQREQR